VKNATTGDWRIHKGIDFIAKRGDEVRSIGNGKVVRVVSDPAWGYCIDVDYGEFTARYCGMEQGTTVIIDDVVSKGDTIGKVGFIPCESKQESHLHFEIVRGGANVDPKEILG
jgi:murein DD-endopeptidase MepM/ murein hydrolase activator NlpD